MLKRIEVTKNDSGKGGCDLRIIFSNMEYYYRGLSMEDRQRYTWMFEDAADSLMSDWD